MTTTILIILLMIGITVGIGFLIYTTFLQKPRKKNKSSPKASQEQKKKPIDENQRKNNKARIDSIKDFYDNFNKLEKEPRNIIKALENVDYDTYDRGKLKDFLQRHGFNFEQREEIMDTLYDVFVEKKTSRIIEKEIPHYRNIGWKDDQIRKHFTDEGYSEKVIEEGFKEFHKKNIYSDYIDRIVKHMKGFVLAGKDDSEILKIFEEHGWPKEILDEALEKTKKRLDEEHSIAFLEEEILKLILAGDSKKEIAKVLTRRGWPEDELKHYYDDIKKGLKNLEEELEQIDINQYNLDKIRDALKKKNWPEQIVEKTIDSLKQNVEFHRKLNIMKNEAFKLVEQGYNSSQLKEKLSKEGWDEKIIQKTVNSINKHLAANNEREKMKQFNDHIFSNDEWHQHITRFMKDFESTPINGEEKEFNSLREIAQGKGTEK
ncbi:MAG: hypothetical protein ACLFNK_02925 [Candidatus Woesearchaeota archaeon]